MAASACRNMVHRRKADVARSHRADVRTPRLSNLSISPGDAHYNAASLAGLVDFMDIFMFVTSRIYIMRVCIARVRAILTITHAAKQTRCAATSRLISTLSASGGVAFGFIERNDIFAACRNYVLPRLYPTYSAS